MSCAISLDAANEKSYIAVRGKNYFKRILKNIRAFRELQEREGSERPRVSVWLTGLKETIAELPEFVKVAASVGVKEVYLQRLVFFEQDAIGLARPDQALYDKMSREEAAAIAEAAALAQAHGMTFSASGAASEPGMSLKREDGQSPWSHVPPSVDRHVLHRQRARAALLHRALLAARLRELHARRRHPADAARNLERRGLWVVSRGALVRSAAGGLRELRPALEPLRHAGRDRAHEPFAAAPAAAQVAVAIAALDEEASIAGVVAGIPRDAREPHHRGRRRQPRCDRGARAKPPARK